MPLFTQGRALIIGVGDDLPNTVQDATALRDILVDQERCAYPLHQVTILTGEMSRRENILTALDDLRESAGLDDTVVLYFSGHGYRVTFSNSFSRYFLMPYGYSLSKLSDTAISDIEFTQRLDAILAKKVLLLLDCCHAGGFEIIKTPGLDVAKAAVPLDMLAYLSHGRGEVVIASSTDQELSYGGRPYSVFTTALVEALCGAAKSQGDGYVRVADIALHARERVQILTNGKQHPMFHFRNADNFPMAWYAAGDQQPKLLPAVFKDAKVESAQPDAYRTLPLIDTRGGALIAGGIHVDHGDSVGRDKIVNIYGHPSLSDLIDAIRQHPFNDGADIDYLEGLRLIIDAAKLLSSTKQLSAAEWIRLQDACKQLRKNADDWCPLLQILGQKILNTSGEIDIISDPSINSILTTLDDAHTSTKGLGIFPSEFQFHVQVVHLCREFRNRSIRILFSSLFELYDRYSGYVSDIVVGLVRHLYDEGKHSKSDVCDALHDILSTTSTQRRAILWHGALTLILIADVRLEQLRSYAYPWIYVGISRQQQAIDTRLTEWLTLAELKKHPFEYPIDTNADVILGAGWCKPDEWSVVEKLDNLIVVSDQDADVYLCALYLRSQLARLPNVFPIWHQLGLSDDFDPIAAIAHSCASTWTWFLAANPNALQSLKDYEQIPLILLLVWHNFSVDNLCSTLRARSMNEFKREDDIHLRWLCSRVEAVGREKTITNQPSREILLQWINLRPYGYAKSCVIATDYLAYSHVETEVTKLWESRRFLQEINNVFLKLMVGNAIFKHTKIMTSPLVVQWSSNSLEKALDGLVLDASGGIFSFGGLLDFSQSDLARGIAIAANRSFSQLIQLGNRLIARHSGTYPQERRISEETLEAVLNE